MSWCWFALVDEWPQDAAAAAWASEPGGEVAGALAAWSRRSKPRRDARRIDARAIDSAGEPATVSLVLPAASVRLPFDDLAVQQARRLVLTGAPFDAVSTMLSDATHFEGAVTVARGGDVRRLGDDPFGRIFRARVLAVEGGLFGRMPWPVGPSIERYGSDQPWPWSRFPSARAAPGAARPGAGETTRWRSASAS